MHLPGPVKSRFSRLAREMPIPVSSSRGTLLSVCDIKKGEAAIGSHFDTQQGTEGRVTAVLKNSHGASMQGGQMGRVCVSFQALSRETYAAQEGA